MREIASETAIRLGSSVLRVLDGYFRRSSLVGGSTFFDVQQFAWIAGLEHAWSAMRLEVNELMLHRQALPNFQDMLTHERHLTQDAGWKTYFFVGYGIEFQRNLERCPATARAIKGIPGMTTAMFSILAPGKRIPPHRGPYPGVLRYHLALQVPGPHERCGIRVGSDVRYWEEGRSIVFDDTFEHEVWNETDGVRVVLFVDFKRPLGGLARQLNDLVIALIAMSPYVRDAAARHGLWEKEFEEAVRR